MEGDVMRALTSGEYDPADPDKGDGGETCTKCGKQVMHAGVCLWCEVRVLTFEASSLKATIREERDAHERRAQRLQRKERDAAAKQREAEETMTHAQRLVDDYALQIQDLRQQIAQSKSLLDDADTANGRLVTQVDGLKKELKDEAHERKRAQHLLYTCETKIDETLHHYTMARRWCIAMGVAIIIYVLIHIGARVYAQDLGPVPPTEPAVGDVVLIESAIAIWEGGDEGPMGELSPRPDGWVALAGVVKAIDSERMEVALLVYDDHVAEHTLAQRIMSVRRDQIISEQVLGSLASLGKEVR